MVKLFIMILMVKLFIMIVLLLIIIIFNSYAPWCPACKGLEPVWEKVAGWAEDLDFKVAKIDVTENPGEIKGS